MKSKFILTALLVSSISIVSFAQTKNQTTPKSEVKKFTPPKIVKDSVPPPPPPKKSEKKLPPPKVEVKKFTPPKIVKDSIKK